jgi:hypothetical protein
LSCLSFWPLMQWSKRQTLQWSKRQTLQWSKNLSFWPLYCLSFSPLYCLSFARFLFTLLVSKTFLIPEMRHAHKIIFKLFYFNKRINDWKSWNEMMQLSYLILTIQ